jgi:DHA3 family macrolide efflux protein-like MFS transporter
MGTVDGRWKGRFFTIWTGQQLSLVGSRAAQFALVWWLTTTTGSATVLASATLVAMIPQIVLGPFVGALIDRWNRRAVMVLADSFIALVGLWLAYLFWSGTMEVWHIYVVMLARSIGEAFHWPAMAASTTLMVPERHYTRIGGLNQTIHGLLNVVGPPLGALLMSLIPLHGVMLVDVATAAFAVGPLLFLFVPQPAREHVEAVKARSFLANTLEGLRFVLTWPGLLVLLAGASILKIALMPAFSLSPLLVYEHFGGGAPELSLFDAMAGIGILVGGLALSVWGGFKKKIYTILLGLTGIGVACIVLGLTPAHLFWLGIAGVFVVGAMVSLTDGPISALLQATVPPEMQGRVFALLGSLFSLTTPLGLAIAGPVADVTGVPFWFLLAGLVCTATALASFFVPALIHIEDQKPPANGSPEASGEGSRDDLVLRPVPAGVSDSTSPTD